MSNFKVHFFSFNVSHNFTTYFKVRKNLLIILLVAVWDFAFAQQGFWSNAGALVSIRENTFLSINGDAFNSDSGFYHNRDTIFVTGDWQHDAPNRCFDSINTGWVVMHGNTQHILGSSITHFFNLVLTNQGIKFGDTDVVVNGNLFLTDREFNLSENTVFVTNAATTSVQRTTGFVSSIEDGGLSRQTESDSVYLFPVGSTLGVARYRPIELTPTSFKLNRYKVRFANTDPSLEGFDRNQKFHLVCEVNPNWYHRIFRTWGSDSVTMKIFYDPAADGTWNDMAHWQIIPEWQAMPKTLQVQATPFAYMQRNNWNNFSYSPYALANTSLSFADAGADTSVINGNFVQLNATGGVEYKWRDAATLTDSAIANPFAFPLVNTTYYVTVTNDLGCEDYDSVRVRVLPRPKEEIPKDVDTLFFIPNTITPNNDGYNDVWYIKGLERFPDNNVRIINRWGDEVFYEEPYGNVWQGYWNGNPLPGATYYYVLKVKMKGEWKTFSGPLTIVR